MSYSEIFTGEVREKSATSWPSSLAPSRLNYGAAHVCSVPTLNQNLPMRCHRPSMPDEAFPGHVPRALLHDASGYARYKCEKTV